MLNLKNKYTILTLHAAATEEEREDQGKEKGFNERNNPNQRDMADSSGFYRTFTAHKAIAWRGLIVIIIGR